MKTIHEVLVRTTAFLEERSFARPRRDAEDLIAGALKMKRLELYTEFDRLLEESELAQCRAFLERRLKREPIQYIVGEVTFCGCEIGVDQRALIPRPETEILADQVIRQVRGNLVDLCCGTGCIGIAAKKAHPDLEVTLVDLSTDALALAGENALRNEVQVELLHGDLCAPLQGRQIDCLVCNPPYIGEQESLEPEVADWEPAMALRAGQSGLLFYHRLARELPEVLKAGARVWLELGAGQGEAVSKIFSCAPWRVLALEADWSGQDRFFSLERE